MAPLAHPAAVCVAAARITDQAFPLPDTCEAADNFRTKKVTEL